MSGQISTGLGTWPDVVARPARLLAAAPTRVGLPPEQLADQTWDSDRVIVQLRPEKVLTGS